jgi:hypothetical protein
MQTLENSTLASSHTEEESQIHPRLWLVIVAVLNVAIVLGLLYTLFKDAV